MAVASRAPRKITWQERRASASLLLVLAEEQTRVAERIVRLREAHALTQEAAAQRAGVTLRQWQRWERGESEPYARNIARISEEFSVPLSELVGTADESLSPSQLDRIEQAITALAEQLEELRLETGQVALEVTKRLDATLPLVAAAQTRQPA